MPLDQLIYWGDFSSDYIERINIDGSDRQVVVSGLSIPQGIYASHKDQKLYWIDRGTDKIQRSDLNGSGIIDIVISGLVDPKGIYLDNVNDKIYWVDAFLHNIKRCNLDGSNIEVIVSGLSYPEDIIVDNIHSKIYWTQSDDPNDALMRSNLDGSDVEILISGLSNPAGLDIDLANSKIYFGDGFNKLIRRCNLDGSSLITITTTTGFPDGVRIDLINGKIYWIEISPGGLYKSDLDGQNKAAILTGLSSPARLDLITLPTIHSGTINLNIFGDILFPFNDVNLFIHGKGLFNNNINLIMTYPSFYISDLDLNIGGYDIDNNNINLFISNNFTIFTSGYPHLFIKGLSQPNNIACPILDPAASIQISDELIDIYQSRIDALINQIGKNVLLEFDPIIQPCTNCELDTVRKKSTGIYKIGGPIPFDRGRKCPYCKGYGILQMSVTKCIKCLIKWNPREIEDYGIDVENAIDIVRLKTFLTDADDLIRARTTIVNYDIQDQLHLRTILIKGPMINGLRESRYLVTFWQLIGR